MAGELLQVSYRELAERLAISPDAARMKAKRAAKSGRWRIIPGNHPSDRVLVELPEADLNISPRVGGERSARVGGERRGRTHDRTEEDALSGQVMETLQAAYDRIHEITAELLTEKDRHKQTAVELAQAETREMGMAEEIHQLEGRVKELQAQLRLTQRTWWERITGR